MKRISLLLLSLMIVGVCAAQVDSVRIASIEGKVAVLESSVNEVGVAQSALKGELQTITYSINTYQLKVDQKLIELNGAIDGLSSAIDGLKGQIGAVKSDIAKVQRQVNALSGKVDTNAQQIVSTSTDLDAKIVATDSNAKAQASELSTRADGVEKSIKNKSVWGVIALALVFAVLLVLSILLHRKGEKSIESLKQSANKLNEEIIGKASVEISEMQKIAASIGALSAAGASSDSEQQLIKTLADRITFMEMTLYKMDSSVRGHKQLTKSIAQMKDNMLANGYEIVDMLGKSYHEGMKVTANFIEDEALEQGTQIITGIIKPQINYKGEMIQAAQITVSQNI